MKLKNLIAGACALCGFVLSAWAKDAAYWDPSEKKTKSVQGCGIVRAETESLVEGWYVVDGEGITIGGTLALTGDVNLILADDATLTVSGGIAGEGRNLTVWGQEGQTGKLVVNGTNGCVGAVETMERRGDLPDVVKRKIDDDLGSDEQSGYKALFEQWYANLPVSTNVRVRAGGTGGTGIACDVLTLNGGEVVANGGRGGNGGNGPWGLNGRDGYAYFAAAGKDGAPGVAGGDGGTGGVAVVCMTCVLCGGKLTVQAGAGGDGGAGGRGGKGGNGFSNTGATAAGGVCQDPDGGDGGRGGDGGKGGDGGTGLVGTFVGNVGELVCVGGAPGSAGAVGLPGLGGLGGSYEQGFVTGSSTFEGSAGWPGAVGVSGGSGVAGKAFGDEPQLMNYTSVTADGEVWNLTPPLTTFLSVEAICGNAAEGTPGNKWRVGKENAAVVTAYIYNDELVIEGTGAMRDFTKDDPAPWTDVVKSVAEITVGKGVAEIGRNAFVAVGDEVPINGFPSSLFRMMGKAYGEVLPSDVGGALAANFEAVEIMEGKAFLNVSVSTNDDLSASTETWQKADIKEAVLKDDGTVTLEIPAPADKGFMILKTRPAEK